MIALDTNVLVRHVVADDPKQALAAQAFLAELTIERPAFVCREVIVELVWVLHRAYRFSRERIATVLEDLLAIKGLEVEMSDDVARAASRFRGGGADFADLMIAAAAKRSGAEPVYTFDEQFAKVAGAALLEAPAV